MNDIPKKKKVWKKVPEPPPPPPTPYFQVPMGAVVKFLNQPQKLDKLLWNIVDSAHDCSICGSGFQEYFQLQEHIKHHKPNPRKL